MADEDKNKEPEPEKDPEYKSVYDSGGKPDKEAEPESESESGSESGTESDDEPETETKSDMPFLDHIEELRWRLIKSIVAIAATALISFIFAGDIYKFITVPLGDNKLYFTEVTGSFYAYLKLSFYTGIIAAAPVVFYQLWKFIGPGLYDTEKKIILPLVVVSTILFLIGGAFCFYIILPFAIKFLIGYGEGVMMPIITVSSYISFAGMLILAFGAAFEMPVVGYFLGKIGIISSRTLSKGRPYFIVAILIVAAILTPPDVFTQVMLAVPLMILFELTVLLVRYTGKKDKEFEK